MPGGGAVSHAVGDVAKERAAFDDVAGGADAAVAGVTVVPCFGAFGVAGFAFGWVFGVVEVGAEFPCVSGHVVEAVAVRWEGFNG